MLFYVELEIMETAIVPIFFASIQYGDPSKKRVTSQRFNFQFQITSHPHPHIFTLYIIQIHIKITALITLNNPSLRFDISRHFHSFISSQ